AARAGGGGGGACLGRVRVASLDEAFDVMAVPFLLGGVYCCSSEPDDAAAEQGPTPYALLRAAAHDHRAVALARRSTRGRRAAARLLRWLRDPPAGRHR